MFFIIQALFLQKTKSLHISTSQIFIWDWYLNLGRKELGIWPSCVRSPWLKLLSNLINSFTGSQGLE